MLASSRASASCASTTGGFLGSAKSQLSDQFQLWTRWSGPNKSDWTDGLGLRRKVGLPMRRREWVQLLRILREARHFPGQVQEGPVQGGDRAEIKEGIGIVFWIWRQRRTSTSSWPGKAEDIFPKNNFQNGPVEPKRYENSESRSIP